MAEGSPSAGRKVVIGITGPTRCGKGRVVKMLIGMLESRLGLSKDAGQIAVIGQDHFWVHPVTVVLPDGREVRSEEEAQCHDFAAFQRSVQAAVAREEVRAVLVEGFTIVHDERVAELCDHLFLLDVSRENTVARRSAKTAHNPNPLPVHVCEEVVWPAHTRYLARAETVLAQVGKAWTRLDANDNGLEMLDSHVSSRAETIYTTCFPTYAYFESCLNGLVLDIDRGIAAPGAEVVMWGKEGGQNQRWRLTPEGYLESELNGLVLSACGGKLVMGAKEAGDHQRWRHTAEGYLESAMAGGLVLDIDRAVETQGAKLVLWAREGGANQRWRWADHP